MKKILSTNPGNVYALIARLALGITIFPHGAQKLLGWFGGYGYTGTMGFLTGQTHLPSILALLVILIEFFGSLLLIFGFLTRVAALGIIGNFLGVFFAVHIHNGFFMNWAMAPNKGEGYEYFILLFGLALIALIAGGGKASIDAAITKNKDIKINKDINKIIMKIALIGASGFVGTAILTEALNRGHEVTAIVRNPANIKIQGAHLKVVKADVLNEAEVQQAVEGNDIVISAYNSGWTNPDIYEEFIRGSKSIESGVKQSGINRFIVIGGAGSLYLPDGTQVVDSPQFPDEWKAGANAARDYLAILKKEKDLAWTFLSPALEMHHGTSGIRKGTYKSGLERPVFDEKGRSVISVEDVAVAVVDEAENPKHIRERFTVAY